MNPVQTKKRNTTRRGFVKTVASGAGGVALANSLLTAIEPSQRDLNAAPIPKSKYDKYILAPEIKKYEDLEVFELKGKDARGYDFAVQLSPVAAIPLMNEAAVAENADRAKAYIGGDPGNVKDLDTEVEISMGEDPEVYKINSASMTYIPKGTPYRQRVLKKPDKHSFVLSLTLPPKYIDPAKSKK